MFNINIRFKVENVGEKVDVICDDALLELPPEIAGIIVLNIPSCQCHTICCLYIVLKL
jgi:hypothetical protein